MVRTLAAMSRKRPSPTRTVRAAESKSAAPAPVYSPTVHDRQNRQLSRVIRPREVESVLQNALLNGDFRAQAELFDMMEDTWPRLTKNLNEVKRAVSRLDYTVTPYSLKGAKPTPAATERAEFVESVLWSMKPDATAFEKNTEGMFYDLLDAHGKGISVVEVYWSASSAGIVPRAARQLNPNYIAFPSLGGSSTQDRILFDPTGRYGNSSGLIPFQSDNFLVAVSQSRSGHPASTALLRSLAKYWIASQFGFQWLVNYAQLFGTPLRWATYDPSNKGLLDDICAMLENIGSSGWGAFPLGTTIEMKEPVGKAADNPQKLVMDIADKACDLLILGQTLTTDVGDSGSRALGDVHMSVRDDIMSAAADWLAGVLNTQLVPAILRLNYGDDSEAPILAPEIKVAEDAKANAERDKILIGELGLPVEKAWLYARHGIPQPAPDADPNTLFVAAKPPAPTAPSNPSPAVNPAQDGDEPDGDEPPASARACSSQILVNARRAVERDRLADAVLERLSGVAADWLRPVRPVFSNLIAKALDTTITDADFIKALESAQKSMPELFEKLDADSLARAMEEAMGAAAVNGAVKSSRRS